MVVDRPVFVDQREESIHMFDDTLEMRGRMIADRNRFGAIPTAKLSNVGDGGVIQSPKSVLVERLNPFGQSNLDAVGKEIILPQ